MNYGSFTYIQTRQAPQPGLGHEKYENRDFCFSAWPPSCASLTHPSVSLVTTTIAIQHFRSLTYLMILSMREYLSLNDLCQAEKQRSAWLPMNCQSPPSCTHKHTHVCACGHAQIHRNITHFYSCMQNTHAQSQARSKGRKRKNKMGKAECKMKSITRNHVCFV